MCELVPDPRRRHKPRVTSESLFDRELRRVRRDRSSRTFDRVADLYRMVTDELIERLDSITRSFSNALILGCPDPSLAAELERRGVAVVQADPGLAFAGAAEGVQCDEDRLPFAPESFDLILSIGLLDSVNDLPGALILMRRTLRPDGLFLAAFVGAGSLPRLRSAMLAADTVSGGASPRIHPQIDVRAAGDLLARAGFTMPVSDAHTLRIRYRDMMALVQDLRAFGATNMLEMRSRRPLLRMPLAAALAEFHDHADDDGRVPEQVEIIHLIAWSPSPDQPRPAKRGSASRSLAEALRRPDKS